MENDLRFWQDFKWWRMSCKDGSFQNEHYLNMYFSWVSLCVWERKRQRVCVWVSEKYLRYTMRSSYQDNLFSITLLFYLHTGIEWTQVVIFMLSNFQAPFHMFLTWYRPTRSLCFIRVSLYTYMTLYGLNFRSWLNLPSYMHTATVKMCVVIWLLLWNESYINICA